MSNILRNFAPLPQLNVRAKFGDNCELPKLLVTGGEVW